MKDKHSFISIISFILIFFYLTTNSFNSQDFSKQIHGGHIIVWSCPYAYFEEPGFKDIYCESIIDIGIYAEIFKKELDTFLLKNTTLDKVIVNKKPFLKLFVFLNKKYDSLVVSDYNLEYFYYNNKLFRFTDNLFKTILLLVPHDHSETLKKIKKFFH